MKRGVQSSKGGVTFPELKSMVITRYLLLKVQSRKSRVVDSKGEKKAHGVVAGGVVLYKRAESEHFTHPERLSHNPNTQKTFSRRR